MRSASLLRSAVFGAAAAIALMVALSSPATALSNAQLASVQVGPAADRIRSKLAILKRKDNSGEWTCSGVLFAPRVVITAAHCLIDEDFKPVEPASVFAARCLDKASKACRWVAGKDFDMYPIFRSKAETTVYLRKHAARSEGFDIGRFHDWNFDLGVVLLSEDAAADIEPIPVSERPPIEGETHLYYGAGRTPKTNAGIMRVQSFPVAWTIKGQGALTSQYQMIASSKSGNCGGDSGGPIFVEREGALLLAGIGVAARKTKKGNPCGDVAAIAIDLSRLMWWVEYTAKQLHRKHEPLPPRPPAPPSLHPATRSALDRLGIGRRM